MSKTDARPLTSFRNENLGLYSHVNGRNSALQITVPKVNGIKTFPFENVGFPDMYFVSMCLTSRPANVWARKSVFRPPRMYRWKPACDFEVV